MTRLPTQHFFYPTNVKVKLPDDAYLLQPLLVGVLP